MGFEAGLQRSANRETGDYLPQSYTISYNLYRCNYKVVFMCHASVEVKKWGNSLGVLIPKDKVAELGLSEKDIIDIDILKKEKVRNLFFPYD